jgi:glucose-6-phosphate isomerase
MTIQQGSSGPARGYTGHVRWKGTLPVPDIRDAEEMAGVLAVPGCPVNGPVYYMYRNVARSLADRQWLREQEIRFDITVIPPRDLCGEFVKTKGHYHPANPAGTGYPEIYEVLEGEAHYLIQTRDWADVVMIAATAGQIVVVPPEYGHVTINPSRTAILQMANLVSSSFRSEYRPYEELHGAAYYEMTGGEFVKNPHCTDPACLRLVKARQIAAVKDTVTEPLYDLVEQRAEVLGFLNHPERYLALFSRSYL